MADRQLSYREAINEALRLEMRRDPTVVLMGEDVTGASQSAALSAREALRLATLGSAEALRLDGEVGSLTPGKRADLAIVSLAGSPYLPWEDPEVAVVFGGTPERVCRTIVDGVTRSTRGGSEWHELRLAAASARGRMLAQSRQSSG